MHNDQAPSSPIELELQTAGANTARKARRLPAAKSPPAKPRPRAEAPALPPVGQLRCFTALLERYKALGCIGANLERELIGATTKKELAEKRELPGFVERRVLKDWLEGREKPRFTPDQYAQIDAYLCRVIPGYRQHSMRHQSSVIVSLAETGDVTLCDGKKPPVSSLRVPRGASPNRSDFDVEAVNFLAAELKDYAPELSVGRRSVMLLSGPEEVADLLKCEYCRRLLAGGKRGDLSIGSPLATPIAEVMLCTMCGVRPFQHSTLSYPRLPFHFIWPDELLGPVSSSFALRVSALRMSHPELAKSLTGPSPRGLLVDGRVLLVDLPDAPDSQTYGVVAIQLRMDGSVWVAAEGVNAVGTLAATKAVTMITEPPRPPTDDRHGDVLWCLVGLKEQVLDNDPARILARIKPEILEVHHWRPEAVRT